MRVEHFMTRQPLACDADTSIQQAAQMMRDENTGSVVVLRDGRVAGIVTDREIALDVVADGAAGANDPVEKIMTSDPATVNVDENIFTVLDTMRGAGMARRAPVIDANDTLVGLVSVSDVAVVARRILDGVLDESTRHALKEPHHRTGGKRIQDRIRNPDGPPGGPEPLLRPVRETNPKGEKQE